ncbi:hypothetical protein SDC9_175596 [bioreactor metagenome]|uniref:Uncharacterized protein n=1 Tax=bioreactor metagenome TaxID=1076179 RepID=A0A645GMQ8_9ZZZZ
MRACTDDHGPRNPEMGKHHFAEIGIDFFLIPVIHPDAHIFQREPLKVPAEALLYIEWNKRRLQGGYGMSRLFGKLIPVPC